MSEKDDRTIRGMRVCSFEEIPVWRRRGLSKQYWTSILDALLDNWVHIGDLKQQTGYAIDTIRTKARNFGYYTAISEDKNWLYIRKKEEKEKL